MGHNRRSLRTAALNTNSGSSWMQLFSTSTYSGRLGMPQLVFFGFPLGCNMWYQLPFSSTYFAAVPDDLRWSEPPTGVTRHSMSHESACHFWNPAMGKLATQKTACGHESDKYPYTAAGIPSSQVLLCCDICVACKWCHRMFGCVAITTPCA